MNSQQRRRKRGVILTNQGFQKLQTAKSDAESNENSEKRFTLEALSIRTNLDPDTLMKVFACEVGVDKRTLNCCFKAFNLRLEPSDYSLPPTLHSHSALKEDWGEAPDVSIFCGRTEELATLTHWIQQERCRMVALLGMGGMGKTFLSVRLVEQIKYEFDYIIWRSLRNAPPIQDMLAELICFFSNKQEFDLPEAIDGKISRLIHYFKFCRCLLILDNAETILQATSSNNNTGCYRQGYEGYGQLFRRVGEVSHQSCLVLTSREKPKGIGRLEGETSPVRVLQLKGLQIKELQEMFKAKGSFGGSKTEWNKLIERYAGNPLALNIVSITIQKVFNGSIAEFLKHNTAIFGEIHHLLKQHFNRLSKAEKQIVSWLSLHYQPASFLQLRENISATVPPQKLLEALVVRHTNFAGF
jgi:hypothetical protein